MLYCALHAQLQAHSYKQFLRVNSTHGIGLDFCACLLDDNARDCLNVFLNQGVFSVVLVFEFNFLCTFSCLVVSSSAKCKCLKDSSPLMTCYAPSGRLTLLTNLSTLICAVSGGLRLSLRVRALASCFPLRDLRKTDEKILVTPFLWKNNYDLITANMLHITAKCTGIFNLLKYIIMCKYFDVQ